MDDGPALELGRSAALIGGYRWAEHQLFRIAGAWSGTCDDPAVCVHLAQVSHEHGWHQEVWADRLPVLDTIDPEALTAPYGAAAASLFDAMEDIDASTLATSIRDVKRLAALYRVILPRMIAGYGRHLSKASAVADAPVIRALRLVLRDEVESWQAGETLLQSLLSSPVLALAANQTQARLEGLVVGSTAGPGLFPWPDEQLAPSPLGPEAAG